MATSYQVITVAQEICDELETDNISAVATWIRANAGTIGNLINISIQIDSNLEYSLPIDDGLKSVIKAAYFARYFKIQAKNSLSNAFGQIISIKDDSSQVTFSNASEISKSYKAQADSWAESLKELVSGYKSLNSQTASSVAPSLIYSKNVDFYSLTD
jgi:hypothetical protein